MRIAIGVVLAACESEPATDDESASLPRMRVIVSDAVNGKPLSGAHVTVLDRAVSVPQRTKGDGSCEVLLRSLDEPVHLVVEAAGHVRSDERETPVPTLFVALARATTLFGRVLAADSERTIGGAELTLVEPHDGGKATSARDGSYELAAVPVRSSIVLEVRAPGFATTRRAFELLGDAPRTQQDIHLESGWPIAGRVEDWESGQGLAGARVGDLVTDANGEFSGLMLRRGARKQASVRVEADGHASLNAVSSERSGLVFRLPRTAFLEGFVTDAQGRALADARVAFAAAGPVRSEDALVQESSPLYELPEGWSYALDAPPATSDTEGRYRLAVLPWSLNGTATAVARGMLEQSAHLKAIGNPGSVLRLDWRMPAGFETRVKGTVSLGGVRHPSFTGSLAWRGPTRSGSARFAEGKYVLDVEPGEVVLSAVLDLVPRIPSPEARVRLVAGEERRLPLDVVTPVAAIAGSVRFDDGTAAVGVDVRARCFISTERGAPPLVYRALTDEQGEFELFVPDIGLVFDVTVPDFDGEQESERIAPGTRGLVFVLDRARRFFVRARLASGGALARDAEVQFLARGRRYGFQPLDPARGPDADGWYESWSTERELDLLALPRNALLPHDAPALRHDVRLDVSLHVAEPTRVELALGPGAVVELQLAEDAEPWPADHELLLVPEELASEDWSRRKRDPTPLDELAERCTVRFGDDRRARLVGLAIGSHRFVVRPADLVADPRIARMDQDALPLLVRWSRKR